ncbi:MAG: peptidoglycan DD-metalloendopeptidase family protein [Armatimonadetes bacterium]|nr:peptidoglycan DD-metalloendopeptidase family protein [Armatimonadota bacterium]
MQYLEDWIGCRRTTADPCRPPAPRSTSRPTFRRLACLLAALLVLGPVTAAAGPRPRKAAAKRRPASVSARTRAARSKLVTIRRQIVRKRAALRSTKWRQRKVSEQIRASEEGLEAARSRLRAVRAKLAAAERRLSESQRRLEVARQKQARHLAKLRTRLVDVYKYGSVPYASVLLHSHDMWDLASRGYLLRQVVRHDADLLARIKAEKAEIARQTQRLRCQRNEVAQLRAETEDRVAEVADWLQERRELQADLSRDRARLEAALEELERNSREVEAMVRAFEARPDISRRIPQPWSGSFARPVAGRITSRFGTRFHPVLRVTKLHTGVDLAAASGTPIAAAGDGVVIHAGWLGGYGNCVVIAHGNGRSTLYGHCSSLAVSEGQRVRRGQTIGRVGSTGFSTGPHLHFEVRHNGVPVNPLSR